MIHIERKLKKKIVKTLWEYGLNANSLYIFIYDDGTKHYRWVTPNYIYDGLEHDKYWLKFYSSYVRAPIEREYGLSDKYELKITIYDIETGKEIKTYYSKD